MNYKLSKVPFFKNGKEMFLHQCYADGHSPGYNAYSFQRTVTLTSSLLLLLRGGSNINAFGIILAFIAVLQLLMNMTSFF